jgi:hypothetical protein
MSRSGLKMAPVAYVVKNCANQSRNNQGAIKVINWFIISKHQVSHQEIQGSTPIMPSNRSTVLILILGGERGIGKYHTVMING